MLSGHDFLTFWFTSLQESRIVQNKKKNFQHVLSKDSFHVPLNMRLLNIMKYDVCFLFWLSRLFLSHRTEKVSTSGLRIFWYQTILRTQVWAMLWTWDNMVSTWCALRECVCVCIWIFTSKYVRNHKLPPESADYTSLPLSNRGALEYNYALAAGYICSGTHGGHQCNYIIKKQSMY